MTAPAVPMPQHLSDELIAALGMLHARVERLSREERAVMLVAFGERADLPDTSPQARAVFLALEDVFRAEAREKGELDG